MTISTQSDPTEFDPFAIPDTIQLGVADDPYPFLAAARRQAPVTFEWPLPDDIKVDEPWVNVLGYDEVVEVLRDHGTYSSGVISEMMGPVLGHVLAAMDGSEHRAHRALVAPAFRLRLLERWKEELIGRVIDELLDAVVPLARADLVRLLAFPFPVRVIARIIGLPERDCVQFQRWSLELLSFTVNWDRGIAASEALRAYFAELVGERRRRPQDDLISELIDRDIDGQRLTDDEIFAFLLLLLPGGIETTYRSLGNLLFALLTHPDQLEEVRTRPELRDAAIEEGLRWETPILLVPRQTVRSTRLRGIEIPAGRGVNLFIGSANRDERRFPDPDRFDIHRPPVPHLSFGAGPHLCLGMHLARMESRVALDAILERLHQLQFDPEARPPRVVGSVFFRSPDSLPVRFGS